MIVVCELFYSVLPFLQAVVVVLLPELHACIRFGAQHYSGVFDSLNDPKNRIMQQ